MTVPFKPEVPTWLADWIGTTQADATRVAPQTPQLPPVPVLTADNSRPGEREALRQAYDNPKVKLGQALQTAQTAAEMLPDDLFGGVASLGAAVREARAGNPGMAALSAAGMLPIIPSLAAGKAAAKAERFPLVSDLVDGRVVRKDTPNLSSISSTFDDGTYDVLPGVREVQLSEFPAPPEMSERAKTLAEEIKQSGELNPLIVVDAADGQGPYILEGAHRYDALKMLGAKSFPAVVVKEKAARKAAKLIGKDANEDVLDIAERMIRNEPMPRVTQVDAEKATRMAKVYEGLPKFDPEAKAAYDLLNEEVAAQAKAIQDAGYKFEFVDSDPYANSAEMMKDVRENKRLKVLKTPRPPEAPKDIEPTSKEIMDAFADKKKEWWEPQSPDFYPYRAGEVARKAREYVTPEQFDQLVETEAKRLGKTLDDPDDHAWVAEKVATRIVFGGQPMSRTERLRLAQLERRAEEQGSFLDEDLRTSLVKHQLRFEASKDTPFGAGFHPYMTPEQNDTFRAVHDWIAHAGPGNQFGPIGEENAYRMHAATLSPQAQRALATETRGQNSWVNFGPNKDLPMKERPFAEQKAALWPEEWLGDYDKMPAGEAERIVHASIRDPESGRYFDAVNHEAATVDMEGAGIPQDRAFELWESDEHAGFKTNTGRFVSREEAARIAKSSDQRLSSERTTGLSDPPKIEAPQLKIGSEKPALDESNLKLVPDYVTDPMERAPTYRPPRADLSELAPMWKRVKDVFAKNADQGLKEGLGAWFDVGPLRTAFLEQAEDGQDGFELLMKLLGPTSSGTNTPQNVKQSSLMYFLNKQDPVKFLDDLRAGTLDVPKGYANRRQSSVNRGVRRILEEGNLSPKDQPKTFRYGNIPTGRYFHSVPLDMHVGRQTGRKGNLVKEDGSIEPGRGFPMPSYAKDKKVATSPANTSYAKIEDHILAEAEKRGVPGAPFMAAGWVKGGMPDAIGGPTGVSDLRGLIPLFNERIALTAQKRGVSRAEALKGFIDGKWPLAAIGGLGAGQGLLMSGAHSDDGM